MPAPEPLCLPWQYQPVLCWNLELPAPALSSSVSCCLCPLQSMHKILSSSGCPHCLYTSTIKFSRLCTKPILFFRSEGKHVNSNAKQARACYLMMRNIFFMDMHGLVWSWSLGYREVYQNRDPVLPAALGGLFWSLIFWILYLVIRSKYSINSGWQCYLQFRK